MVRKLARREPSRRVTNYLSRQMIRLFLSPEGEEQAEVFLQSRGVPLGKVYRNEISRDPAGPMGSGLSSLYAYASNNPLRYTDPSGRNPACAVTIVAGAETGPGDLAILAACEAVTDVLPWVLGGFAIGSVGVVATVSNANVIDQKQGGVIPQPLPGPAPRIEQPLRPEPPIKYNPFTGDQEPPGAGGDGPRPPMWFKILTGGSIAAVAGSTLLGDNQK